MAGLFIAAQPSVKAESGCSLSFDDSKYQFIATDIPFSGRRFYLYSGFGYTAAQWSGPSYSVLMAYFKSAGHQVVLIGIPVPQQCFFSTGGWQYREQFVSQLNAIMNAVEAQHGPAVKNIAGGISFGGLHSMIAQANSGRIQAWWASLPVTRIDQLTEMASVGNVQRFNPFYDIPSLAGTTGLITWGTADSRTNYVLTKQLAGDMGSKVTKIEYPGQDHSTTPNQETDIINWIASTL